MDVKFRLASGCLTLKMKGELDHHGARGAIGKMAAQIDSCLPRRCVLDFSGVSFMDSSGIAVVLSAYRRMNELEGVIAIENVPEQAKRVFDAAGLDRLIEIN